MKKRIRKLQTRLQFKRSKEIDGLHLNELYRKKALYDKPIYIYIYIHIGASLLHVYKVHLMGCHYEVIHKKFEGSYSLIYSDTDSFMYSTQHEDIYEWVKENANILTHQKQ